MKYLFFMRMKDYFCFYLFIYCLDKKSVKIHFCTIFNFIIHTICVRILKNCLYKKTVMGIKGRRVHMIEELSETIISFQRGKPMSASSFAAFNHALGSINWMFFICFFLYFLYLLYQRNNFSKINIHLFSSLNMFFWILNNYWF